MNVHVICRYLIIENFIPPEEKTKLMNRAVYDEDEDVWILRPLANKKWAAYLFCAKMWLDQHDKSR